MAFSSAQFYPYDKLHERYVRMFKLDLNNENDELSGVLLSVYLHFFSSSSFTAEAGFREYVRSTAKLVHQSNATALFSEDEYFQGFDALSCTWGPDKPLDGEPASLHLRRHASLKLDSEKRTVVPHGDVQARGIINIGPNLEAFLRHLRKTKYDRWIWIDQICIGQPKNGGDPEEFGLQARLMFELYTVARRVIIWLGDGSQAEVDALSKMPMLTKRLQAETQEKRYIKDLKSQGRVDFGKIGLPDSQDSMWTGLSGIVNNPWLGRLWTLQEVIVSQKGVVRLGQNEISLDEFFAFELAARSHGLLGWLFFTKCKTDGSRPAIDTFKHITLCRSGWEYFKEMGR